MVTSFDVVPGLLPVASASVAQLEWPQEAVGLLEVRSHREDLVNQIFDTNYSIFSKNFLDNGVFCQCSTPSVDLSKSSLVDQFTNSFQIWIPAKITTCTLTNFLLDHVSYI